VTPLIKVFDRNPDPLFDPKVEVGNHQILSTQFFARFEQVHKSLILTKFTMPFWQNNNRFIPF